MKIELLTRQEKMNIEKELRDLRLECKEKSLALEHESYSDEEKAQMREVLRLSARILDLLISTLQDEILRTIQDKAYWVAMLKSISYDSDCHNAFIEEQIKACDNEFDFYYKQYLEKNIEAADLLKGTDII